MTTTDAWLLECSDSLSIAVSDYEMVEYLDTPVQFEVPGAPEYCPAVLLWQENLIPVMDISVLLGQPPGKLKMRMSVLTYQEKPGASLQQLAVCVNRAPQKIAVDDEQVCELPEEINTSLLGSVSLSCFSHCDQAGIILDLGRLCSAEFRDMASPAEDALLAVAEF